jgi:hypothetical protein
LFDRRQRSASKSLFVPRQKKSRILVDGEKSRRCVREKRREQAANWAPFTSHKDQAQGAFAETSKLRVTETFADTGVTEALVRRERTFTS